MKFIKKSMFLMLILMGSIASAKSFSLQVVQKYGSETVVYEASYVIEQTIMDYFYVNLYIVSNSPVIIQKKGQDISSELQKAFDAAQEGYHNLSDSNNPEEALLNNIDKIEWKVFSIDSKHILASGKAVPGKKYRNDEDGLYYFSNELAEHIKEQIECKGGKK